MNEGGLDLILISVESCIMIRAVETLEGLLNACCKEVVCEEERQAHRHQAELGQAQLDEAQLDEAPPHRPQGG